MLSPNAPKDIIAEHVRQLLDLDEGGQRAQLANLSNYAAAKSTAKGHSGNGGASRSKSDRVRPGVASSASVSTYGGSNASVSTYGGSNNGGSGREPSYSAESTESSGSEGLAKSPSTQQGAGAPGLLQKEEPAYMATHGETSASQQLQELQHSTDLLKAALANWEACLQVEEANTGAQQIEKAAQQVLAADQTMPAKIPVQTLKSATPASTSAAPALAAAAAAPAATDMKSGAFVNALQKALTDLNSSLPVDTTKQVSQQGGQQRQQESSAQDEEGKNAMKWLRQHLEKQQEESMMKIMKMMQGGQSQPVQQQAGWDTDANYLASAATQGYSGAWPPVAPGIPQTPAFAGAFAGQPMFPPLAMPGAFDMPAMVMEPPTPWNPQMGMPGAYGLGNPSFQRPVSSQVARQQPQNQRYGSAGAYGQPSGHTGNNNSRKNRAAPPAGIEEETLRTHLCELQKVEPDNVILVRKINRLGFESPAALKAHFSKYGKVDRVLVAHSHVKSHFRRCAARLRPSGLGFVVMSNKADADAILAQGPEQIVAGGPDRAWATIRVQRFQRRSEDAKDADLEDDDEDEQEQEGEVAAASEDKSQ